MIFHIITIFPEFIRDYLSYGILSRAEKDGIIEVLTYDLREFAVNKYGQIDGHVFGHGRGMLFRPEPLFQTVSLIKNKYPENRVLYLSPQGKRFTNKVAKRLKKEKNVILIAARYEGIDSRIVNSIVDEEISVGDYIVSGGELPALIVMDSIARLLEGSIKKESSEEESFENGLLEYDHFTGPIDWMNKKVPEVLRSGNHKEIEKFRLFNSLRKTYFNRIDLFLNYDPDFDTGSLGQAACPEQNEGVSLKKIRKKNERMRDYLKNIEKISEEWKDAGRNSKG